MTARALNDYETEVELADLVENGAFLAHTADGEAMSVREKGPLWIIYPVRDGRGPGPEQVRRMVWQLRHLTVK